MARMKASEHAAIDTRALTASFGWDHSDSFVQHDVQELNRVLFQAIEEYIEKTRCKPFLTELYEQEMQDVIQCCTCRTQRHRTDKYQDVPLLVKGCWTLEDSLQNFVQEEELEGIDCEQCGCKQTARKGLVFQGFPKILTLQLRRFDFDFQTLQRVKVHDAMQIPLVLDVRRWLPTDVPAEANTQYQLLSILLHRGTALGGHYFVYIRDVVSDKWYSFNDETVEEVSLDDVRVCLHQLPVADIAKEEAVSPLEGEGSIIGPLFEGQQRTIAYRSDRATPYMLVYRSCDLSAPDASPLAIPECFLEVIAAENDEARQQQQEYERVKDLVELRVFHRGAPSWVIANQHISLPQLTELAYTQVFPPEEKEQFPLSQVRLRAYNTSHGVMGRSYGGEATKSLKQLGLGALATVAFETRNAEEQWEEYTCDDLSLQLHTWREEIQDWAISRLCIRGDATCEDLLRRLAVLIAVEADHLVVSYKETPTKGRRITPTLLPKRLLGDLNVGQSDHIFVEDAQHCPHDSQGQLLPHGIRTIEAVNFWTFHFNRPGSDSAVDHIVFDSRRSFQDLKSAIAEKLQLPVCEFRLKRDKRSAVEAANPMSNIIRHTIVQSGTLLFVELGRPLSDNDLNLSVYKYSMQSGVEKLELLFKRIVSRDTPLADLRRDLSQATGIPCDRLRLREVSGNSVRQALTLRTLRDHFAEGRGNAPHLAAQEVEAPESLTPNDLILRITPFTPDAERCGATQQREIIVDRNATVRQLKRKIGEMYGLEQLTVAKVLNAVLETNPKNVLFDNIGSLASVEQYQESIITKPPLSLRDNDNLFFKEGDEFTKPGLDQRLKKIRASPNPAVRPQGGSSEKALVIRTEFQCPAASDAPPESSWTLLTEGEAALPLDCNKDEAAVGNDDGAVAASARSPDFMEPTPSTRFPMDFAIAKPYLSQDNLFFKEGEEFAKPGMGAIAAAAASPDFWGSMPSGYLSAYFDDTAAEAGDDDRSEMTTTPPEYTDPEYAADGPAFSEQFDAVLSVVPWDPASCTDMDGVCAICLCGYEDGEQVGITPCQHAFHPECFHPWFQQSASCPACLTPLPIELH
eukprot:GGOE01002061.1.p1 GENE.GGOE01002061.1~~GGOE01002061.1.p1  ORF type:complete len:1202 (+),score=349.57 GGOE01002061.1:358-3606(+)